MLAYTHPLWMFCLSIIYLVIPSIYPAAMLASLFFSLWAGWLVCFRVFKTQFPIFLSMSILILSKAFIDYSTSGLENPLTHLILVMFFVNYTTLASEDPGENAAKRQKLYFLGGLGAFNRLDTLLLICPALIHVFMQETHKLKAISRVLIGFSPFIAWEIFSLFYYGFPFPNTAYTKLNMDVPISEILEQGFYYLLNSLNWDPITLLSICSACVLSFYQRKGRMRYEAILCTGLILYLLYLVRIGGDYMSGRHLSAPLLLSALVFGKLWPTSLREVFAAVIIVFVVGLHGSRPTISTDEFYKGLGSSSQWVDDERGFRHDITGLMTRGRYVFFDETPGWISDGIRERVKGRHVVVYPNVGFFGFEAGAHVHVIDPFGLTDPLLARLTKKIDPRWAPGHYKRRIPEGYLDSALDGSNKIHDPDLAVYWDKLRLITRGDLWSLERLKEVLLFNLTSYNYLRDRYEARQGSN